MIVVRPAPSGEQPEERSSLAHHLRLILLIVLFPAFFVHKIIGFRIPVGDWHGCLKPPSVGSSAVGGGAPAATLYLADMGEMRVYWEEDGELVDDNTAKRPYKASPRLTAEIERILDREARRQLDEELSRDAA